MRHPEISEYVREEIAAGIENEGLEYYFRFKTNTWKHEPSIPQELKDKMQKFVDLANEIDAEFPRDY